MKDDLCPGDEVTISWSMPNEGYLIQPGNIDDPLLMLFTSEKIYGLLLSIAAWTYVEKQLRNATINAMKQYIDGVRLPIAQSAVYAVLVVDASHSVISSLVKPIIGTVVLVPDSTSFASVRPSTHEQEQ